ncbi:hypothetical protein NHQ30_007547 [Ciborinia camelliae]|nr:hypothetical protein NHQ30_007547 [Ciborinia camelliae]
MPQESGAMAVLEDLGRREGADLEVVRTHPDLDFIELGLPGDFWRINASLAVAVAVAAKYLSHMGSHDISETTKFMQSPLPEKLPRGLENARWPGRCETRDHHWIRWLLDGAHTMECIGV